MKTRLEAFELRREELKQTLRVLAAEEPKAVQKREAVTAKTADLERRLTACRKEKETVHGSLALAERVRREAREKLQSWRQGCTSERRRQTCARNGQMF